MARSKQPAEELQQLKAAMGYLAAQWEKESSHPSPAHAKTLKALLARIEALPPRSSESQLLASVYDAMQDGLRE